MAATIAYPTIGYGGNVSAITWLGTGGPNGPVINTNQAAPAAESVTHVMWSYFINILPATSAGGNTLSFGAATMPTGSVIMNVLLTQLAVPPGNANPGLAYLTASPW